MIEDEKQFKITKDQFDKLQSAIATFDMDKVADKVGSKKLAEMELMALKGQADELLAEIREFEKSRGGG
jgi:hypothetical protein